MTDPKLVARRARKRKAQKAWLDNNPQIRDRRNKEARSRRLSWSDEKKARIRKIQQAHYVKRTLRATQGLCGYALKCNEPAIGTQKCCLLHWCYGLSKADPRIRSIYSARDLVSLWNRQQGKCAISGVPLIPGDTASLDHIVPVAKKGTSVIENLRFIHWSLNKMKWDMTEDEFRGVVLEIGPALLEWARNKPTNLLTLFR